jgi:hypothetical protein
MSDDELRRDLAEEDELRRLLHRTEPAPVPPFAAVARRADRRTGFGTFAATAGAALVVIAAIVLWRLASQAPAVASPSALPESTVGLAGQNAQPSATPNPAVLKSGFGVIYSGVRQGWDQGSAPQIRREGETDRGTGELAGSFFNNFHGMVSPSGRRAAYTGQTQDGQWGLYLLDGARPAEQRRLLALPNEIPGEVAWAADETAIAFNVQDHGATQGVAPKYSAIRTLDLASGMVNELARVTGGNLYHIVAWNKASGTLAATIAPNGEPATTYVVIGPAGTKTTPLDGAWGMYGSPDARTAIGVRCDGAPTYCSLWTWPLDDFGSRADQHLESGLWLGVVGWRPGSNEIGLVVGSGPKGQEQIEVWSPTAGRHIVYRFVDGKTPPSRPFFRADGSAIFVPGYGEAVVVDIATTATSPLPFPAPAALYERPLPAGSIRLDQP